MEGTCHLNETVTHEGGRCENQEIGNQHSRGAGKSQYNGWEQSLVKSCEDQEYTSQEMEGWDSGKDKEPRH